MIDPVSHRPFLGFVFSTNATARADGVVLGQLHVSWAIMVRMTMLRHET
jgi:hypothetical protein